MTADDLLCASSRSGPEPEAREAGENFLRELLASGPMPSKEVEAQAKEAGVKMATLRRAADKLGVRREKCDFTKGWQWRLPKNNLSNMPSPPVVVSNMSNMSTLALSDEESHIKSSSARAVLDVAQVAHVYSETARGSMKTATYTVTIRTEPGYETPPEIRLRRFLKLALRGYGLRCIQIRQDAKVGIGRVPTPPTPATAGKAVSDEQRHHRS